MSSKSQSYSSSSFITSSYSSSTSSHSSGQQPQHHSQRYTTTSHSDSDRGTTTTRRWEESGRPTVEERMSFPADGGRTLEGQADGGRRIEDVSDQPGQDGKGEGRDSMKQSDQQKENDRLYEERMEDEYAKREGGA